MWGSAKTDGGVRGLLENLVPTHTTDGHGRYAWATRRVIARLTSVRFVRCDLICNILAEGLGRVQGEWELHEYPKMVRGVQVLLPGQRTVGFPEFTVRKGRAASCAAVDRLIRK